MWKRWRLSGSGARRSRPCSGPPCLTRPVSNASRAPAGSGVWRIRATPPL
jgi:hypothetical protein